jgi:hypothetical protein
MLKYVLTLKNVYGDVIVVINSFQQKMLKNLVWID